MDVSSGPHAPAGHFTPGERVPGTHWIGVWEGPRASVDVMTKRLNICPSWERNPGRPDLNVVTILTELSRLQIHGYVKYMFIFLYCCLCIY
jgi:hypothetical protein